MTSSAAPSIAEHQDWLPCYACGGSFCLGVSEDGAPMALHTDEACAAFDALADTRDACQHADLCRVALQVPS